MTTTAIPEDVTTQTTAAKPVVRLGRERAFPPGGGYPGGLSIREYIAAHALAGVTSLNMADANIGRTVRLAVEYADALLAELAK